ncbi:MAG: DUF6494 family protein [Albidovulum sp.]|nr:DUF6494 family protein [Albidovulum sp.]
MSGNFNMTMRKLLKQVGVTSQHAIEEAMREAGVEKTAGKKFATRITLTVEELGLTHVVEGTIDGKSE